MTPEQAGTLATFALQAMPRSKPEQRTVLLHAIEKYPEELAADAIVKHAEKDEFINVPAILKIIQEKQFSAAEAAKRKALVNGVRERAAIVKAVDHVQEWAMNLSPTEEKERRTVALTHIKECAQFLFTDKTLATSNTLRLLAWKRYQSLGIA